SLTDSLEGGPACDFVRLHLVRDEDGPGCGRKIRMSGRVPAHGGEHYVVIYLEAFGQFECAERTVQQHGCRPFGRLDVQAARFGRQGGGRMRREAVITAWTPASPASLPASDRTSRSIGGTLLPAAAWAGAPALGFTLAGFAARANWHPTVVELLFMAPIAFAV